MNTALCVTLQVVKTPCCTDIRLPDRRFMNAQGEQQLAKMQKAARLEPQCQQTIMVAQCKCEERMDHARTLLVQRRRDSRTPSASR